MLCHLVCCIVKRFHFKYAERTVPYQSFAFVKFGIDSGNSLFPYVEQAPTLRRNMFQIDSFMLGHRFEFLGYDNINRQNDFTVVAFGCGHNLFGRIQHIHLYQRVVFINGINAVGFHKSMRHAAGNDQFVNLLNQIVQQVKLGRNFGTADNCNQRANRVVQAGRQRIDFFFH